MAPARREMGRPIRLGGLACLCLVVLFCGSAAPAARADWDYLNAASGPAIEAYSSEVSVLPGQDLHFHVSTAPAEPYRIFVYRLGPWSGRGPQVSACVPGCRRLLSGGRTWPRPSPSPVTGQVRANWPVTDTFHVPHSWPSGYYAAKVVLQGGAQDQKGKLVPFVVRAPPGSRSTVLVVAAVNTWQAYNDWGGTSLYVPTPHATKVSFDRPYASLQVGSQSLFNWELPLIRFLEAQGYDISYTTDVDVDRDPGSVLGHRLVVVAGHSEYWTGNERRAFDGARDAGVNVFFAGANDGFWQIRYEDGGRTIVGYKEQRSAPYGPDPQAGTPSESAEFRNLDPPDPECRLIGIASRGSQTTAPGFDRFVVNGALGHPWFAGTGFGPGAVIPNIVGYEWDQLIDGCSPPLAPGTALTTLFHTDASATNGTHPNDSVTYTAPSGARVFSAGSFEFPWGLDGYGLDASPGRRPPDGRLKRFARNMLHDLAGAPAGALRSIALPKSVSLRSAIGRGIQVAASVRIPGATVRAQVLRSSGARAIVLGSARRRAGIDGRVRLKVHVGRRLARRLGHGSRSVVMIRVAVVQPSDAAQVIQRQMTLTR